MKNSNICKNFAYGQKNLSLPPVEKHQVRVLRSEEGKVIQVNCLENVVK